MSLRAAPVARVLQEWRLPSGRPTFRDRGSWAAVARQGVLRKGVVDALYTLGKKMGGWVSMALVGVRRGASQQRGMVSEKGPRVALMQRKEVLRGQRKVIHRVG
ncbi:hypothetical protein SUGI_0069820 [Cryptomeria japonica]|nr:hypothetical protein SUGI_0069820 [Cryptomeria japonica]